MFKIDESETGRNSQVENDVLERGRRQTTEEDQRVGGDSNMQEAYHRFLWDRPRADVHPGIGSRPGDVHRPRSLVVVDPGDVLRGSIASTDGPQTPG